MRSRKLSRGFSLIEVVLVVAIIGIVAAIAIPRYLGAKRHAMAEGEGRTAMHALAMALETYKADNALYPPAATYTWNAGSTPQCSNSPVPQFVIGIPKSHSLRLVLVVNANRLTYTIRASDPVSGTFYTGMDQNGQSIAAT